MNKMRLPRNEKPEVKDTHTFHVEVPLELWQRMIDEAGITWGKGRAWALAAFQEKLDREKGARS